jgi:hypothetical protein
MKDMQDDASKERNDIDATIIRLPTPKQTKFSHRKSHTLQEEALAGRSESQAWPAPTPPSSCTTAAMAAQPQAHAPLYMAAANTFSIGVAAVVAARPVQQPHLLAVVAEEEGH